MPMSIHNERVPILYIGQPTTSPNCDFYYAGPIEIADDNRVDNISLWQNVEISFELKTVLNCTCPGTV